MDVNIDYRRCMTTLPLLDPVACCVSGGGAAMSVADAEMLAGRLKALSDPTRLRLLSQPTVSHHLKVLTEAGFLTRSKRGTWAYYRLVPGALDAVAGILRSGL
jgi:ArsR family transcriptional regulator